MEAAGATGNAVRLSRTRRVIVSVLVALATLLAIVSIFAIWADRQLLDADNWADTSTAMLGDADIRDATSIYVVDQIYSNVNVDAELARALPPRLKPLSGPAAGGLRNLAVRGVDTALGDPRVQEQWRRVNRAAAQQFIDVAEGRQGGAVTGSNGAVVLDLGVFVRQMAQRLGLPGTVASRIPPGAGRVTIVRSDTVRTLQNGANAVNGLANVLPFVVLALLALAVYLARGRRRPVLLAAGWAFVVAGVIVLVGRILAGNAVVDSLVTTDAVRPAAESAWSIGTRMLRDVAQAAVIIGIPVIVAAWLAGTSRPAVALRSAMAPWLHERPEVAYGVGAALGLLAVAWGPIPATRQPLPVLIMFALLMAGVAVLRRQTEVEFPGATVEGARASLRERMEGMRGSLSTARRGSAAGGSGGAPSGAPPSPVNGPIDRVALLERLAALHDSGVLTDEEFAEEKRDVLHANGATS